MKRRRRHLFAPGAETLSRAEWLTIAHALQRIITDATRAGLSAEAEAAHHVLLKVRTKANTP